MSGVVSKLYAMPYDDEDFGPPPTTRHQARPPRRYQRQQADNLPYQPAMSMAEVEERLVRADDELAELTATHMDLADQAANAEADWKAHLSRVITRMAASGEKSAADTREAQARAEVDPHTRKPGDVLYRDYKVTQAAAESSARAMRAIEARLNAFQTIAANLRKVAT